ncbi:hypothetical protein JVU11DRAFT_3631 [Chiua virens]|nr:hypothetical protein JVU11DRAFT_3631 [Chiua virens]
MEDGDLSRDHAHEGEWIATATIIAPSEMPDFFLAPFKQVGAGGNWQMYGLFWMWVHPAHRGKGFGAQMVEACLEWAQTHVDPTVLAGSEKGQGGRGNAEKVVILLVKEANVAGHALYTNMGFTIPEGIPPREGALEKEKWMLIRL